MGLKERLSTVFIRGKKETRDLDEQLKAFLMDRAAEIWSQQSLFALEHQMLEEGESDTWAVFTQKRHTGENSVIE